MLNVIKCVEETGIIIISLTEDRLPVNITKYESLGGNFEHNQTYLKIPTYPEKKIYIILDPPHMLKLIRKRFTTNKTHHGSKLINRGLLEIFVEKQSSDNFNLCNKLTKLPSNWHQKSMSVKLAAETISKSVADTIRQLRKDGYEEFEDSEAMDEFIMYFSGGCSKFWRTHETRW